VAGLDTNGKMDLKILCTTEPMMGRRKRGRNSEKKSSKMGLSSVSSA
jgi:hypothetical protein